MEFHWALVACLGVMMLGTLKGIVVAIVLSLMGLLRLTNDPRVDEIRRKPGTNVFRPRSPEHPDDESMPGLLIVRPEGRIYFGNAANVGGKMQALAKATSPQVILLDCSAMPGFEYTALKMLVEGEERPREQGRELWLAALNPEALELVQRTPLAERLGTRADVLHRRAGGRASTLPSRTDGRTVSDAKSIGSETRERVLDPVDRVSEMLFGLFMALTFVGAVSVATAGREEIKTMLVTALGCNLAWGLVDAVMYLVRTITERGRALTLVQSVRAAADAGTGRKLIEQSLSPVVPGLVSAAEIEAVRARLVALPALPAKPTLQARRPARRPRDIPDRGRGDFSRRAALRVHRRRRNGEAWCRAASHWRCCSSAGWRWAAMPATAA